MRVYHADIAEHPARDGTFTGTLRGASITATGADPEHDLAFSMMAAGLPDGSIQFWRGPTPTLLFRSVHRTAGYRIKFGDSFPYRLVRRREVDAEILSLRCPHDSGTGKAGSAGTSGHPEQMGFPENPRIVCEVAL